ncbi:hypothetical protein FGO68_gene6749 [Halteria grandinella]|uniref:Uncharacterized protein n=1 Tax=Halteria grandinella TaxID=5974 RepID=A0A8J8T2T5_HALGN|nr:hypothetical protein FGO68_gene6749 [Halteria grandinella]
MESTMMRDIGWGKSYEWGLYNQWKLWKQHGDEEGSEEAAYGDYTNYQNNSMFAQRVQAHLEDQAPNYSPPQIQYNPPQQQIQPQYSVTQLSNSSNQYQYPLRIFVREDKCLTTPLMETPGVEDFNDLIQNITDKQALVNQVNEISTSKGFRLYRHSDTGNTREHRLVLLCSQYGICRCPFMLIYWKDFTKLNGAGDVAYQLMKYRSEHNHQLVSPSANSNDMATQNLFEDLQRQATSILQQTQSLMIQHQQQQQQLQNAYTLSSLTNPTFPTQNFQMPNFPSISAQQGSYTHNGFSNLSGTITANQLLPDNPFQLNNSPHESSTNNNSPIFQFGAENPLTANFGNEVNSQQQQVQKGYKLEECVQKKRKEQQVMPKS